MTPLHAAALRGRKEIAELLIAEGADANAKVGGGVTSLHFAANKGHKEIAELLIAKGADVNTKNENGYTPLDLAKRHPKVANLLRKHGGKTAKELGVNYLKTDSILRKDGKTGEELKAEGK